MNWNHVLWNAVSNGNIDGAKEALSNGADIHAYDERALGLASSKGQLQVVQYLVEQGADIHAGNEQSLRLAAGDGHLEIVKYLVEQGADIHAKNDYALRIAVYRGHALVRDYLLFEGADPQKVVDDILMTEGGVEWAKDFINARDLANKLTNDLAEKSSKADKLVASIDEDAEAPAKKSKATRQKI